MSEIYCPMVGECPHKHSLVIGNSFFLIEPFDEEKENREKAVENALTKVFTEGNFLLSKADEEITSISIYCDICRKISASSFCIVDLTPKKVSNELVIRPNVALELGLAYGKNKPAIILLGNLAGGESIPSDIRFVRYYRFSFPITDWESLENELAEIIRDIYLGKRIPSQIPSWGLSTLRTAIPELECLIEALLNKERIYNHCKVVHLQYDNTRSLIAIITDPSFLRRGMVLRLLLFNRGLEQEVGKVKVSHIQNKEQIAQAFCFPDNVFHEMWRTIENDIIQTGQHNSTQFRVEPVIDEKEDLNTVASRLSLLKGLLKQVEKKNKSFNYMTEVLE